MPKYKNNNATDAVIGSNRIPPGETYVTTKWYQNSELPSGVVKTSDLPVFNPMVHSEKVTNGGTVTIPEYDGAGDRVDRYLIHIYVSSGEPTIKFNDSSVTKSLLGYPDMKWNVRVHERLIEKLIISGTSVVYIEVELI